MNGKNVCITSLSIAFNRFNTDPEARACFRHDLLHDPHSSERRELFECQGRF